MDQGRHLIRPASREPGAVGLAQMRSAGTTRGCRATSACSTFAARPVPEAQVLAYEPMQRVLGARAVPPTSMATFAGPDRLAFVSTSNLAVGQRAPTASGLLSRGSSADIRHPRTDILRPWRKAARSPRSPGHPQLLARQASARRRSHRAVEDRREGAVLVRLLRIRPASSRYGRRGRSRPSCWSPAAFGFGIIRWSEGAAPLSISTPIATNKDTPL